MPSYQVTDSSTYGRQGHYGQTNMAYNGHGMEMNEKNRYDKPPAYNTGGYSTGRIYRYLVILGIIQSKSHFWGPKVSLISFRIMT